MCQRDGRARRVRHLRLSCPQRRGRIRSFPTDGDPARNSGPRRGTVHLRVAELRFETMQLFASPCVRQSMQRSQTCSRWANAGIAPAVLAIGGCGSESPPLTSSSSQTSVAGSSRAPSTPRDRATAQRKAADPKAKVTATEQIGRSTIEAIKTGNVGRLLTPLPGMNAEIAAEINETRALAKRDSRLSAFQMQSNCI